MPKFPWKTTVAIAALVAATTYAFAQMSSNGPMGHGSMEHGTMEHGAMQGQMSMQGQMPDADMMARMQDHQMMQGRAGMHGGMNGGGMGMGMHGGMQATNLPAMPGQDAFGAIQEIVQILESDPKTDWSKVNIEAVRQHLIDMNEVTLHAVALQHDLDDGIEIAVTGEGRTAEAIKRMVPALVSELREIGWNASSEDIPNGVKLTVTATDAQPLTKLKALGFIGIMVQGSHHQRHHLMMALGQFAH